TTPTVLSRDAGTATSRRRRQDVESPPSNRIATRQATPTSRASGTSSNSIPPTPSDPRIIPSPRKAISDGTPLLDASSAATMLAASPAPPSSRISPSVTPRFFPSEPLDPQNAPVWADLPASRTHPRVDVETARRLAVRAQLLDGSATGVLDTVRRLGFLQLDP